MAEKEAVVEKGYGFASLVQEDILRLMATDPAMSLAASHWVKPSYFAGEAERWVASLLIEFYEKHSMCAHHAQVQTEIGFAEKSRRLAGKLLNDVRALANKIYQEPLAGAKTYTIELVQKFAQQRAWEAAILEAIPYLKEGNTEILPEIMSKAQGSMVNIDSGGYWFFESAQERIRRRKDDEEMSVLPTGILELDICFRRGGLRPPEVGMWMAPRGRGKCATGNTLISTPGGLRRLDEIVKSSEHGWHLLDKPIGVYGSDGKEYLVGSGYCNGFEKTKCLILKNGVKFEGTLEHRVMSLNVGLGVWEWKKLEDVKVGDYIAEAKDKFSVETPERVLPLFDNTAKGREPVLSILPKYVNSKLACWIALLLAEGYYGSPDSSPYRFSFTNSDRKLIDIFVELSMVLFGFSLQAKKRESVYVVTFDSKKLFEYLCGLGIYPSLSREKRIPDFVRTASEKTQHIFLQYFFESEGSVITSEKNVEISSASENMIRGLGHLLRFKGVQVRIYSIKKRATNGSGIYRDYYRLVIAGIDNLRLFAEVAGFPGWSEKSQKLLAILDDCKHGWKDDLYPGAQVWVKQIFKEVMNNGSSHGGRIMPGKGIESRIGAEGRKKFDYAIKRGVMSRRLCEKALDTFDDCKEAVKGLCDLLRWRPILVKDVYESYAMTYDIEVPTVNSYIANGLVSHNSIALSHVAKRAVIQKWPTAFYSMEMAADQVADRLDSSFTGVKMWDMKAETEELMQKMGDLSSRYAGMLMIRQYPTKSRSIDDIRRHLDSLWQLNRWRPKLIVLDYIGIVKPPRLIGEKHLEMQETLEAFRELCDDMNCVGWTAAQINREGARADTSDGTHASSSWDQLGTADVILTLNQKPAERRDNLIRIFIDKCRDGKDQITVGPLETDWERMQFVRRTNKSVAEVKKQLQKREEKERQQEQLLGKGPKKE